MTKKIKSEQPLVSVIMVTRNSAAKVSLALESLIHQTYENLEILIVDSDSCDATLEKMAEFALSDSRIKILEIKKSSPGKALYAALKLAQGELIALADPADISLVDRLKKQVDFLLSHPQTVLVGGQCFVMDKENEIFGTINYPTDPLTIYRRLFSFKALNMNSIMINRALLPQRFLICHRRQSLESYRHELVFWLARFGELANLDQSLIYYSLPNRETKESFREILTVRLRAIEKHHYRPSTLVLLKQIFQCFALAFLPSRWLAKINRQFLISQIKTDHQRGLAKGWRNLTNGHFLREKPFWSVFFFLLASFVLVHSCRAAILCETQYGGGESCREVNELILDKKIWDPVNQRFEDNLVDVSPEGFRFSLGKRVIFRIKVKNESNKTIENLRVQDSLPVRLKYDRGDLNFEIAKLEPGQTEERQVEAIVDSIPASGFDCEVENVVTAENADYHLRDTSRLCVGQKKMIEVKILPKTGAAAVYLTSFSLLLVFSGWLLVRLKKES